MADHCSYIKSAGSKENDHPIYLEPFSDKNREVVAALAIGIITALAGVYLIIMAAGGTGLELSFTTTLCSAAFGPLFLILSAVSFVAAGYFGFKKENSPDNVPVKPEEIIDRFALSRAPSPIGGRVSITSLTPSDSDDDDDELLVPFTGPSAPSLVPSAVVGGEMNLASAASVSAPADGVRTEIPVRASSVASDSAGAAAALPPPQAIVAAPPHQDVAVSLLPQVVAGAQPSHVVVGAPQPPPQITRAYLLSIQEAYVKPIFNSLQAFLREMIRCEYYVTSKKKVPSPENEQRDPVLKARLDSLEAAMAELIGKFTCSDLDRIAQELNGCVSRKAIRERFLGILKKEIGENILVRLCRFFDKEEIQKYIGDGSNISRGIQLLVDIKPDTVALLEKYAAFLGGKASFAVYGGFEGEKRGKLGEKALILPYFPKETEKFFNALFHVGYFGFLKDHATGYFSSETHDFKRVVEESFSLDLVQILRDSRASRTPQEYTTIVQRLFLELANRFRARIKERALAEPAIADFPHLPVSRPPTLREPLAPVIAAAALPAAPVRTPEESASASVPVVAAAAPPVAPPQKAAEDDSHPAAAPAVSKGADVVVNLPPPLDAGASAPFDCARQEDFPPLPIAVAAAAPPIEDADSERAIPAYIDDDEAGSLADVSSSDEPEVDPSPRPPEMGEAIREESPAPVAAAPPDAAAPAADGAAPQPAPVQAPAGGIFSSIFAVAKNVFCRRH